MVHSDYGQDAGVLLSVDIYTVSVLVHFYAVSGDKVRKLWRLKSVLLC